MMLSVWLYQCSVLDVMVMSRYVYHPLLYSCEEGGAAPQACVHRPGSAVRHLKHRKMVDASMTIRMVS